MKTIVNFTTSWLPVQDECLMFNNINKLKNQLRLEEKCTDSIPPMYAECLILINQRN